MLGSRMCQLTLSMRAPGLLCVFQEVFPEERGAKRAELGSYERADSRLMLQGELSISDVTEAT
jgi:hypothetical protein